MMNEWMDGMDGMDEIDHPSTQPQVTTNRPPHGIARTVVGAVLCCDVMCQPDRWASETARRRDESHHHSESGLGLGLGLGLVGCGGAGAGVGSASIDVLSNHRPQSPFPSAVARSRIQNLAADRCDSKEMKSLVPKEAK